jgi:hypothetical protein
MKSWMLALSLVVVIGFSGFVDAKEKGKKGGKGLKGTIATLTTSPVGFTMTLNAGKKKDPTATAATVTVITTGATITGGTPAVGAKVSVVGSESAGVITATQVTIAEKKGGKKKPA